MSTYNLLERILENYTNKKLPNEIRLRNAIDLAQGRTGEICLIDDLNLNDNGGYNRGADGISVKSIKVEIKVIIDQKSNAPTISSFLQKNADVLLIYVQEGQIQGMDSENCFLLIEEKDFSFIDDGFLKKNNGSSRGKFILPKNIITKYTKNGQIDIRSETDKINFVRNKNRTFDQVYKYFNP